MRLKLLLLDPPDHQLLRKLLRPRPSQPADPQRCPPSSPQRNPQLCTSFFLALFDCFMPDTVVPRVVQRSCPQDNLHHSPPVCRRVILQGGPLDIPPQNLLDNPLVCHPAPLRDCSAEPSGFAGEFVGVSCPCLLLTIPSANLSETATEGCGKVAGRWRKSNCASSVDNWNSDEMRFRTLPLYFSLCLLL